MDFWGELFQYCEDDASAQQQSQSAAADNDDDENNYNNKRPSKRRRVGLLGRSASSDVGFTSLLKGRYKLPTVYLLISLLKETMMGSANMNCWERLRELAHELPSIFKTFAENDILAGLAMVGLADIATGKPMPGLSASGLFTTYLSRVE